MVTLKVLNDRVDIHGRFFPVGIEDINMDGDLDRALVGWWYRNEGNGLSSSR